MCSVLIKDIVTTWCNQSNDHKIKMTSALPLGHASFIFLDVCFLSIYQVMYMIALEKSLV